MRLSTFLMMLFFMSLLTLTLATPAVHPQVTTADLEGTITNEQDQLLSDVNINVRNEATGIVRGTASTANGRYRLNALKPGSYEVAVKHIGHVTEIKKKVRLEVGQVVNLSFQLKSTVLAASDTVVVIAQTPLVETTESDLGIIVNELEIRSLPLNTRNPIELALLAPGVSAYREPNPPIFSPINFGAQNNRATRVFVDGLDLSSDLNGGNLPTGFPLSQNSVEQFDVVTNRFKAEYGNTAGGIVNLVSKSGTNELQGSVFGLFRDDALNAIGSFEPEKPPYERQQFGLSLGGPIVKNRTHFFVSFERNDEDAFSVVTTNGVFPNLEGTFKSPTRITNIFAKVDHQLSANQWIAIKYLQADVETERGFGGNIAHSFGSRITGTTHHVSLTHKWIVTDRLLSEFRFGFTDDDFLVDPLDTGPTLIYPSVVSGRFPAGTNDIKESRFELGIDLSYHLPELAGEHNWKFGFGISRDRTDTSFDPTFTGQFIFPTDTSSVPMLGLISDGDPDDQPWTNCLLNFYLQDDWSPVENLTLNLGLRYDVETNASNQNYTSTLTDPELPFIVRSNRPIDKNNIAPRLGFAYDPMNDGKMAVRGGYGIFYDRIFSVFPNFEQKSDQYFRYVVFMPGTTNRDEIDLTGRPFRVDWLLQEEVPTPYTRQFSIGISRQLTNDFALDIDYIGAKSFNQLFARHDTNAPDANGQRPLPQYNEVFVVLAAGESIYKGLQVVLRKSFSNRYQFRASYTLSEAENDFDDPIFARRGFARGPAGWDERHRLTLNGLAMLPMDIQLSWLVALASARPFSVFTGTDDNRNGEVVDDRPDGVSRNSERADSYSNVDLRLSKVFPFKGYNLELIAEVFNLFNTVNFISTSYNGNLQSPNFGQPSVALPPRQVQMGFRVSF